MLSCFQFLVNFFLKSRPTRSNFITHKFFFFSNCHHGPMKWNLFARKGLATYEKPYVKWGSKSKTMWFKFDPVKFYFKWLLWTDVHRRILKIDLFLYLKVYLPWEFLSVVISKNRPVWAKLLLRTKLHHKISKIRHSGFIRGHFLLEPLYKVEF